MPNQFVVAHHFCQSVNQKSSCKGGEKTLEKILQIGDTNHVSVKYCFSIFQLTKFHHCFCIFHHQDHCRQKIELHFKKSLFLSSYTTSCHGMLCSMTSCHCLAMMPVVPVGAPGARNNLRLVVPVLAVVVVVSTMVAAVVSCLATLDSSCYWWGQ